MFRFFVTSATLKMILSKDWIFILHNTTILKNTMLYPIPNTKVTVPFTKTNINFHRKVKPNNISQKLYLSDLNCACTEQANITESRKDATHWRMRVAWEKRNEYLNGLNYKLIIIQTAIKGSKPSLTKEAVHKH